MVEAGEDPRFIARRLVISASEDIGMADPTALLTAVAAADAVAFIGMPEGHFPLAQAVVHLATAPKSNAVTVAIGESVADVRAGLAGPVPPGLRDAHYAGAKKLGHGKTYVYPHDHPDGVVPQQYPPDALVGRDYYRPTNRGRRGADSPRGWASCGRSSAGRAEPHRHVRRGTAVGRPATTVTRRRAVTARRDEPVASDERPREVGARVSAGEIAGLIAAGALVLLVVLLAVPAAQAGPHPGRDHADDPAGPRADARRSSTQASTTVAHVNSNLERVDGIADNAANVSSNVAALTSVVAATLGSPLIKVAAFSYGVRSAAKKTPRGRRRSPRPPRATRRRGARAAPPGGPPDAPAVLAGHGHHHRRPRRAQAARAAEKMTPGGIAGSLAEALRDLADAIGDFGADIRAAAGRAGGRAARRHRARRPAARRRPGRSCPSRRGAHAAEN